MRGITITVNGSMPAGLKSTVKNEQGEIVELKVIMPPSVTGKSKASGYKCRWRNIGAKGFHIYFST